ncbi:TetR/AcrR family transcriptional regulator [Aeromicrobium ginsengisoli]|uniref:TetR/AcrR family transcriptional regulator n=1 Tax=Aeromicrobium ginsengisoli TaxID=363867 RepID=UPI00165EE29E|nr:TetR/AcrR family transcriptional regulator [Aeromicrobium ginsengisoli]
MRKSAQEQRAAILVAALEQFGVSGLDATPIDRIARRASVSAPYVHRLFGTKSELISAAIGEHTERLLNLLRSSRADRESDGSPLQALESTYFRLSEQDLGTLRRQLHVWGAAHDPALTATVQSSFESMWAEVGVSSGADPDEVRRFMAHAVLLTILASLDLMDLYGMEEKGC